MTVSYTRQNTSPLTVAKLATLLRIENTDDGQRLLDAATQLCKAYLRGGVCPNSVMDEAIIRTAGHINSRQGFGTVQGMVKASSETQVMLNSKAVSPVRQSGAGALLSPFVRRTA